jgi:hypothetical protein
MDFNLLRSKGEFVRTREDGWFKYSLVFLVRDEGWEVNPTMSLRNNLVEDIYHKISGFERKYQKGTPTLATSFENYINDGREYRFFIFSEDEIDEVVSGLFDLFERVALPFYQKYQSIENIDRGLNEKPDDSSLTGLIFKGFKGLIVAKLINRSDYKDLVEMYFGHYQQFADGFYLSDFEKLISELNYPTSRC